MFDLKTQPWFIVTNSKEEYRSIQEWLFSQELVWCDGETKVQTAEAKYITNCWMEDGVPMVNRKGFMHGVGGNSRPAEIEIFISYETKKTVYAVQFPEVESQQQKDIRALEATIAMAQEQIQKLKQEI